MPTTLSLSGNFFTRTLPAGIGQLKRLETMDISENNLSGSIPVHITGLWSLLRLSLSNNGLSGRVPCLNGLWQVRFFFHRYPQEAKKRAFHSERIILNKDTK